MILSISRNGKTDSRQAGRHFIAKWVTRCWLETAQDFVDQYRYRKDFLLAVGSPTPPAVPARPRSRWAFWRHGCPKAPTGLRGRSWKRRYSPAAAMLATRCVPNEQRRGAMWTFPYLSSIAPIGTRGGDDGIQVPLSQVATVAV